MAGYKIRDLEILSGIKAHTIRMWEKRYGLLNPKRTTTQIRTYSDEELLLLLNISLLYKNGYKISHIAKMNPEQLIETSKAIQESGFENSAAEQLIVSVLQLDEHLFQQIFKDLIEKNSLSVLFSNLIIPFLQRIGVMWVVGTITPAQEHFISNLIRQKIIGAIDSLPIPDSSQKRIILYLPEHEWHEISLLVYHYHLRSKGFNSIYLGQALPFGALLKTIRQLEPGVIVSSWLTAIDQQQILAHFQELQNKTKHIKIAAGGYQIDQLKNRLPEQIKRIQSLAELEELI
jgi:MerR family transcriptional regulator, light-induced transcriptional regulator